MQVGTRTSPSRTSKRHQLPLFDKLPPLHLYIIQMRIICAKAESMGDFDELAIAAIAATTRPIDHAISSRIHGRIHGRCHVRANFF